MKNKNYTAILEFEVINPTNAIIINPPIFL